MSFPYRRVHRRPVWLWLGIALFLAALGSWWVGHVSLPPADADQAADTAALPPP